MSASEEFEAAVERARNGDIEAARSIPEIAERWFAESHRLYPPIASSSLVSKTGDVAPPYVAREQVEPALSAEEWHEYEIRNADGSTLGVGRMPGTIAVTIKELSPDGEDVFPAPAVIALANDALHPDDPRKITREWITDLRRISASHPEHGDFTELLTIAAALESYLPPETPT
jgi:hypothetical protein